MMNDDDKTKRQLKDELKELRLRIAELERLKAEHNQVDEALRRSEEKYRDLYDNAPDMYHSLDKDGKIIDCNETEARMLGYKKEEIIGRPVTDFFTAGSRGLFERDFPKLNEEKVQLSLEREFVRKDGTTFPASLSVFSEFDESGKLIKAKTIARDITEKRKMEEEILKVAKLESIGILAGGIAHDFNNILTAILGNISVAITYLKPEDEVFERLREAEKASLRAKDLTHQLLTFSKGGAPIKKPTSIEELIKDSASFAMRGSNVRYELTMSDDLWLVEVDEGQMSQVINNLLINADEAMPDGGIVNVRAENKIVGAEDDLPLQEGKYLKIAIEDQGTGIPTEYLHKMFDPYFTTKQKGNGLGLAVTYSIIRKHGGYITVESEIGVGTSFYIYLPASPKQVSKEKTAEERPIVGKGRILLMDDEEMVRNVTGEMLNRLGYEVEFARDGAEAVKLYEEVKESAQPYEAVIMDLTIPGGMGGKEAVQKLIEIDPKVKAIVSSGYFYDPVMANFRKYGFRDVITKPYKIAELSKVLHKVITGELE